MSIFLELFNEFRRGVSVGWYRYIYKFATPVGFIVIITIIIIIIIIIIITLFYCRPNTGRSPFEEEKTDLLHKYNKISLEEAGLYQRFSITNYFILLCS